MNGIHLQGIATIWKEDNCNKKYIANNTALFDLEIIIVFLTLKLKPSWSMGTPSFRAKFCCRAVRKDWAKKKLGKLNTFGMPSENQFWRKKNNSGEKKQFWKKKTILEKKKTILKKKTNYGRKEKILEKKNSGERLAKLRNLVEFMEKWKDLLMHKSLLRLSEAKEVSISSHI